MRNARKKIPPGKSARDFNLDGLVFWLALALLVAVPLAFSTLVYTKYSLPKFIVLLVGSSALTLLLALRTARFRVEGTVLLRSRLVWIAYLYLAVVGLSTIFGVAPLASLFGSHFNYMGLITRLCFLIVFVALIAGTGMSEKRLRAVLWGMAATGFLVAAYGVAQSFGIEPFVSRNLYTFKSPEGPLVRVSATLGHSNYLGNFLLYTTPISVGLALAVRGWPRLFAVTAAALSVGAIILSGTRGAWIGIAAGGVTFALFELKRGIATVRGHPVGFVGSLVLVLLLALIVVISPASRSAGKRMKALMSEGTSSSGRLLLWRDSLGMVPSFPLVGCGPEGFRKAFLAFKSTELARLSPKANNESPHSAYLEAVISHGILGAALYAAMISLALTLLVRARRRLSDRRRLLVTGLLSSLVAAGTHNIFIFDQIATGLYFFAFIALAQTTSNVAVGSVPNAMTQKEARRPTQSTHATVRWKWSWSSRALVTGATLLVVGSVWYSAGLVRSERAYRELMDRTNPVDFDALVKLGERITSSPLPTGAYDFVFARAVDSFIGKMAASSSSTGRVQSNVDLNAIRVQATRLGIEHVQKSLQHTLSPELNYSVLASLALAAGDVDRLRDAATEAVRWDPKNYYTRSLMAEAYLVRGERDQAASEAEIALDLYHVSPEAASVLARAKGENPADEFAAAELMARSRVSNGEVKRSVDELIEVARKLEQSGKLKKAQIKLLTASFKADGPCPECHRELAIVYERMGRYSAAIAEWEKYLLLAPERAAAEQIKARVETLRQKNRLGQ